MTIVEMAEDEMNTQQRKKLKIARGLLDNSSYELAISERIKERQKREKNDWMFGRRRYWMIGFLFWSAALVGIVGFIVFLFSMGG